MVQEIDLARVPHPVNFHAGGYGGAVAASEMVWPVGLSLPDLGPAAGSASGVDVDAERRPGWYVAGSGNGGGWYGVRFANA